MVISTILDHSFSILDLYCGVMYIDFFAPFLLLSYWLLDKITDYVSTCVRQFHSILYFILCCSRVTVMLASIVRSLERVRLLWPLVVFHGKECSVTILEVTQWEGVRVCSPLSLCLLFLSTV